MSEIRDRLMACLERLDMVYDATVRWQQIRIDRDEFMGGITVFDVQNSNGEPILAPILAAQAQVLAALATLDATQTREVAAESDSSPSMGTDATGVIRGPQIGDSA